MAHRYRARLILTGRRDLNSEISQQLQTLTDLGGTAEYFSADVTDFNRMNEIAADVRGRYGMINGVFHAAIVLKDAHLMGMTEEMFREVYEPKVTGTSVLYRVFADSSPDFLVSLSSANSFLANAGQGNYVAACAYKDAFAVRLRQQGVSWMKNINWGFWGDVGIVAGEMFFCFV